MDGNATALKFVSRQSRQKDPGVKLLSFQNDQNPFCLGVLFPPLLGVFVTVYRIGQDGLLDAHKLNRISV